MSCSQTFDLEFYFLNFLISFTPAWGFSHFDGEIQVYYVQLKKQNQNEIENLTR